MGRLQKFVRRTKDLIIHNIQKTTTDKNLLPKISNKEGDYEASIKESDSLLKLLSSLQNISLIKHEQDEVCLVAINQHEEN